MLEAAQGEERAGQFPRQVVGYRPVVPPRFTSDYVPLAAMRREIQRPDNWFFGPRVVYRRRQLAEIGYFDELLGSLCDGLAPATCWFSP